MNIIEKIKNIDDMKMFMFLLIGPMALLVGWMVIDFYQYETSSLIEEETSTLTDIKHSGGFISFPVLFFDNGRVVETSERRSGFVIGEKYNLKIYESGKIDYEKV